MPNSSGRRGKAKYSNLEWGNVCSDTRYERRKGANLKDQPLEYDGSEYTPEQIEFIMAIEKEKRRLRKVQLTVKEVLSLVRRLGYVRMPL